MFKFLHAADIHLDSPLRGLQRYPLAPVKEIRQATRRAFVKLVDLALQEKVQLLVLAGDLYDGDWKDYHAGLFLVEQLRRLAQENIRVALIAGNHDAANRMTRQLPYPDNVRVFGCDAPETHRLDDLRIALHGQSFANPAVTEDLSLAYPAALPGYFNIGILHTCAMGKEGHDPYAPCTLENLRAKGYDYWALGHIHQREVLMENPFIVFPGNLQGRHIRETGPKGCYLVEVNALGKPRLAFQPVDVFRWLKCQIDIAGMDDPQDLPARVRDCLAQERRKHACPLAVRIEIVGTTPVHAALLARRNDWENKIIALADSQVWIEKIVWLTNPPGNKLAISEGPLGEIFDLLEELRHDEARLLTLVGELREVQDLARKWLQNLGENPAWMETENLQALLDQVGPLLLDRLTGTR